MAPTTVASVASTTLTVSSLPPSATFQVSATATSSANTAGDSLTYYVRPTHKNLQVLVPAYFSASGLLIALGHPHQRRSQLPGRADHRRGQRQRRRADRGLRG